MRGRRRRIADQSSSRPATAASTKVKKKRKPAKNVLSAGTKKYMLSHGLTRADLPASGSGKHGAYTKFDIDLLVAAKKKEQQSSTPLGDGGRGEEE